MIDAGQSCGVDEASGHVERADLLTWLRTIGTSDVIYDLSVYSLLGADGGQSEQARICGKLAGILSAYLPEEIGATHNGFALLIACCVEAMRMSQHPHPYA